jgi:hypothetical protein
MLVVVLLEEFLYTYRSCQRIKKTDQQEALLSPRITAQREIKVRVTMMEAVNLPCNKAKHEERTQSKRMMSIM